QTPTGEVLLASQARARREPCHGVQMVPEMLHACFRAVGLPNHSGARRQPLHERRVTIAPGAGICGQHPRALSSGNGCIMAGGAADARSYLASWRAWCYSRTELFAGKRV